MMAQIILDHYFCSSPDVTQKYPRAQKWRPQQRSLKSENFQTISAESVPLLSTLRHLSASYNDISLQIQTGTVSRKPYDCHNDIQ
jgi:hypothetical protein